ETGQLMLVRSDDDGLTWSPPINITKQVKRPESCFILQGPGKGITMRDGTIVFAAQYQDPPEKRRLPHSTIIYSKDHGETWQVGTGAFDDTTESQVVEVEPGVLMLNCRYNRAPVRVVMTTRDMGQTWQKHPTSQRALIEPGACMASLIDVDQELGQAAGGWLLFSNPDVANSPRRHITIKASPDQGQTWPARHRLLLDEGASAGYSCLTMIDENTVGILYEGSQSHLTFQRVPLRDILGSPADEIEKNASLPPVDLFVLTGQSNSLGTVDPRDAADPAPPIHEIDQQISFFWSNRSTRAGDSESPLIGSSGGRFTSLTFQQGEGANPMFWGPEISFARELYEAGQRNFAIIKASRGGGGNRFWSKDSSDAHMFRHVVDTVATAVRALPEGRKFQVRAILYVQGESDSQAEAEQAGHRLETLIDNLRQDLPNAAGARLLVGGIAAGGARRDVVRRKQAAAAERNAAIEYVDNSDLHTRLYDGLHFDKHAKLEVGARLAARWSQIVNQNDHLLRLPFVFSDHMVLQADMPIPVWGTATPLAKITARLGDELQTTEADAHGAWQVRFEARRATFSPTSLVIESAGQRLVLNDVLVGEVWLCAGQSNMEWPLGPSVHGASALRELAQQQEDGDTRSHWEIRLLDLTDAPRGDGSSYGELQMPRLHPDSFLRGHWTRATPPAASSFSAVAWYFGQKLGQELDVPVGLICPAVGGSPAEAWIPRDALAKHSELRDLVAGHWLDNPRLGEFCPLRGEQNLRSAMQAGLEIPGDELGPNHPFKPGFMYAAGIEPLLPFAIRGAIWYQGESNAETPERVRQHRQLFPFLVQQWRSRWGQGEFPFLYVQLPALNRPDWPLFRETQRRALAELNNLGMAITIDTGHPTDVHPHLKKPVGERLAAWALGTTYRAQAERAYAGPLLKHAEQEGERIVVAFEHVGAGLKSSDGAALRHFEVCGDDCRFHPATAEILGEDKVSVRSPGIAAPRHVRYAWLPFPNPVVNLVNSEGLPASPFTTQEETALFAPAIVAETSEATQAGN
ncbi:MAG: exo-alpha-sialidase, partial [Planctomycetales bacterium]|nr:exo-alpha-sialidase [Planctomycetales bacterium]